MDRREFIGRRRSFHGCAFLLITWLGMQCAGLVLCGANGVETLSIKCYDTWRFQCYPEPITVHFNSIAMEVQEDLEALKKRSTAKGAFSRKVTLFKKGLARGDSRGVVETFYNAVNKSFDVLEMKCDDLITFINDNALDDCVVEEIEHYILDCERIRN
ncbi:uncharacterized protein LOC123511354 [Portunus trituberculatus]|uniref:uncharacterized protein LOC123511354 n=1 Tax=Portunus trituberculatus TaxID=210409 RepID=UPI001E1CF913|nr:uncharacterized protein LOC123511354 [Portunus trituberculatus]